jgi:hypothetical protein
MGFSGILYGLYWLYALNLTQQDKWGWVLPAILLFKVNWDIYHQGNSSTSDLIQAPIIYAAHIYGILTATLIALPNRLYVYYQQTKKTLV